jgi:hypothetical protein
VALTGQKKGWQVLGQIVGCPLYGREPSRSNWDVGGEGGVDAWARGNTATGGQRHSSVACEGDAKRLR